MNEALQGAHGPSALTSRPRICDDMFMPPSAQRIVWIRLAGNELADDLSRRSSNRGQARGPTSSTLSELLALRQLLRGRVQDLQDRVVRVSLDSAIAVRILQRRAAAKNPVHHVVLEDIFELCEAHGIILQPDQARRTVPCIPDTSFDILQPYQHLQFGSPGPHASFALDGHVYTMNSMPMGI